MVARSQFEIEDNWDVHGMRGTGSHNIVIRDQFIPEHRTLQFKLVTAGQTPGKAGKSGNPVSAAVLAGARPRHHFTGSAWRPEGNG